MSGSTLNITLWLLLFICCLFVVRLLVVVVNRLAMDDRFQIGEDDVSHDRQMKKRDKKERNRPIKERK